MENQKVIKVDENKIATKLPVETSFFSFFLCLFPLLHCHIIVMAMVMVLFLATVLLLVSKISLDQHHFSAPMTRILFNSLILLITINSYTTENFNKILFNVFFFLFSEYNLSFSILIGQ